MFRIPDVAEKLKISERHLSDLITQEIIPCYRLGRLVFLDLEEVYDAIRLHGSAHRIKASNGIGTDEHFDLP